MTWQEQVRDAITLLKQEKRRIVKFHHTLSAKDLISPAEREIFVSVIRIIDIEINRLETDLAMDEIILGKDTNNDPV